MHSIKIILAALLSITTYGMASEGIVTSTRLQPHEIPTLEQIESDSGWEKNDPQLHKDKDNQVFTKLVKQISGTNGQILEYQLIAYRSNGEIAYHHTYKDNNHLMRLARSITLEQILANTEWQEQVPSKIENHRLFTRTDKNVTEFIEFSPTGKITLDETVTLIKNKSATQNVLPKHQSNFKLLKSILVWTSIGGVALFACKKIYDSYKKKHTEEDLD